MVDVRRAFGSITTAIALVVTGLVATAASPAAAVAKGAPHAVWGPKKGIDYRVYGTLKQVSCPTASFCAAIDAEGNAVVERNGKWARPKPLSPAHRLVGVSCPTSTFCIATDARNGWFRWSGRHWSKRHLLPIAVRPGEWSLVSCASTAHCLLTQKDSGRTYSWTGNRWHSAHARLPLGRARVIDVACPTARTCFAGTGTKPPDATTGKVYRFHGGAWTEAGSGIPAPVKTLSCPTVTFCVAVVYHSVDGQSLDAYVWSGRSWKLTSAPVRLTAVDCAQADRCLGLGWDGATSSYNGINWSPPTRRVGSGPSAPDGGFLAVNCSAVDECTAITHRHAATYTPLVGLQNYTFIEPPSGDISGLSCPTPRFCVAVDMGGQAIVMHDGVWSSPRRVERTTDELPYSGLEDVSCTSPRFCLAIDEAGAYRFDGQHWSKRMTTTTIRYFGTHRVSCASSTFCVIAGGKNQALMYDGKTFSDPQKVAPGDGPPGGVACPTTTFCVETVSDGAAIWSHRTWHRAEHFRVVRRNSPGDISCSSEARCVAMSTIGWYAYDRGQWTAHKGEYGPRVSCAGRTCLSIFQSGTQVIEGGTSSRLYKSRIADAVSCATAHRCFVAKDNRLGIVQKVTLS